MQTWNCSVAASPLCTRNNKKNKLDGAPSPWEILSLVNPIGAMHQSLSRRIKSTKRWILRKGVAWNSIRNTLSLSPFKNKLFEVLQEVSWHRAIPHKTGFALKERLIHCWTPSPFKMMGTFIVVMLAGLLAVVIKSESDVHIYLLFRALQRQTWNFSGGVWTKESLRCQRDNERLKECLSISSTSVVNWQMLERGDVNFETLGS